MIISCVACGDSAKDWHNTPCDLSIGVNDAYKWGSKFDILALFNHKSKFLKERLDTILNTRPVQLYTNCQSWEPYFDNRVFVKTRSYDGLLYKDIHRLTSCDTSPMIAMSLAYCLGASKIILWGADFQTHATHNPRNPNTKIEMRQYQGYCNLLRTAGVEVFLGAPGSLMENFLPIYEQAKV